MSKMQTVILPAAALALVVSAGIVQGVMTDRWGAARDIQPVAESMKSVPMTLGDWSASETEVPPDQLERGEIDGYLSRRYVNRKTGTAIDVLVVLGRPGPISVHTPDVCFKGAGYEQLGATQKHSDDLTGVGPCQFSVCSFAVPSATLPETVRVFWAWSADGNWDAPENPRFEYAGRPYLFKLYAVRTLHGEDKQLKDEECLVLMKDFLPAMKRAVFDAGRK